MSETRIRYVHHREGHDVGIQHNEVTRYKVHTLTLATKVDDTVVMEKVHEAKVVMLRLLNTNYKKLTPTFFKGYEYVRRLEVGCAISIYWLFRHIPFLHHLESIRFGRQVFGPEISDQDCCTQRFRKSPFVSSLEINYDQGVYFQHWTPEKTKIVDSKISLVLELAKECFPALQSCDIDVPKSVQTDLDKFLISYPVMFSAGEQKIRNAVKSVSFRTVRTNGKRTLGSPDDQVSPSYYDEHRSPPYDDWGGGYVKHPKIEVAELQEVDDVVVTDDNELLMSPGYSNGFMQDHPVSPSYSSFSSVSANSDQSVQSPRYATVEVARPSTSGTGRNRRQKSPSLLS